MLESFIGDFNAVTDRRIYYEVVGDQIIEGEFNQEDTSSDEDEWSSLDAFDQKLRAFSYMEPRRDAGVNEHQVQLMDQERKKEGDKPEINGILRNTIN